MHSINFVILTFVIFREIIWVEAAVIRDSHSFQSVEINNNKPANTTDIRQARIYFDQLAQVPGLMLPMLPMLPIEINVPDSIMGMMNGLMVMWSAMQEYFSSENSVAPRIAAILEFIL